jgi:hypothetical protein
MTACVGGWSGTWCETPPQVSFASLAEAIGTRSRATPPRLDVSGATKKLYLGHLVPCQGTFALLWVPTNRRWVARLVGQLAGVMGQSPERGRAVLGRLSSPRRQVIMRCPISCKTSHRSRKCGAAGCNRGREYRAGAEHGSSDRKCCSCVVPGPPSGRGASSC